MTWRSGTDVRDREAYASPTPEPILQPTSGRRRPRRGPLLAHSRFISGGDLLNDQFPGFSAGGGPAFGVLLDGDLRDNIDDFDRRARILNIAVTRRVTPTARGRRIRYDSRHPLRRTVECRRCADDRELIGELPPPLGRNRNIRETEP